MSKRNWRHPHSAVGQPAFSSNFGFFCASLKNLMLGPRSRFASPLCYRSLAAGEGFSSSSDVSSTVGAEVDAGIGTSPRVFVFAFLRRFFAYRVFGMAR